MTIFSLHILFGNVASLAIPTRFAGAKKKQQQQQQPRKQKQEQTLKIVVSSFHLLFTDRHLAIQTVINGVHKDNKT